MALSGFQAQNHPQQTSRASVVTVDLVVDTSRFTDALSRMADELARFDAARDRRLRHWARHHPLPLPIDGHAYRRRTLARHRRNR